MANISGLIRKMPLKFAANISTMFTECENLVDRYQAAKDAGFSAVECQFPYEYDVDDLSAARSKSGLQQILINSFPGHSGELGFASKTHYVGEFRSSLDLSIQYAKALGCKRIHLMAGLRSKLIEDVELESTYIDNLKYAADILEKEDIIGVIEPMAPVINELYFLQNFQKAVEYIKKVDHPNLKLLLDIFHLQQVTGNITENISQLFPYVGHIQVSQVPLRNQLDALGEINYEYVLGLLEQHQYKGWVGLEYKPTGPTRDSLKWIQNSSFWG